MPMAVESTKSTMAMIIIAYMNGTASVHISLMYCRNIHILGSRPHAGAPGEILVALGLHLP